MIINTLLTTFISVITYGSLEVFRLGVNFN